MREDRVVRALRPSLALVALAAVVVLLGLAIAGPAGAATAAPSPAPTASGVVVATREDVVRFGEDVVVSEDTQVPMVVAFGGDVTVNGTVTDSVVAFGGNVVIKGTVEKSVVAFGGDVKLGPDAVVGEALAPTDASLVLFGGNLTRAPGAQVVGEVQRFTGLNWGDALSWIGKGALFNPLLGLSLVGWLVQTAFFLVLALVAAALMPRQFRGVQRQLGSRPWASLGWGALTFFVAAPAILIVLVISVIGLLLVLPYGLFVLLAYFFVTTTVAAFLAQKVLTGFGGKENLMLSVVVGVVGTTVASRIPVAGPVLLMAMTVIGTGAAILGVAEWRRDRRAAAAAMAAAPAGTVAPAAVPQPAVITPMVQTAPAPATSVPAVATTLAAEVAPAQTGETGVPAAAQASAITAAAEVPGLTAAAEAPAAPAPVDAPEAPGPVVAPADEAAPEAAPPETASEAAPPAVPAPEAGGTAADDGTAAPGGRE